MGKILKSTIDELLMLNSCTKCILIYSIYENITLNKFEMCHLAKDSCDRRK